LASADGVGGVSTSYSSFVPDRSITKNHLIIIAYPAIARIPGGSPHPKFAIRIIFAQRTIIVQCRVKHSAARIKLADKTRRFPPGQLNFIAGTSIASTVRSQ
jgi:hypothetical protein